MQKIYLGLLRKLKVAFINFINFFFSAVRYFLNDGFYCKFFVKTCGCSLTSNLQRTYTLELVYNLDLSLLRLLTSTFYLWIYQTEYFSVYKRPLKFFCFFNGSCIMIKNIAIWSLRWTKPQSLQNIKPGLYIYVMTRVVLCLPIVLMNVFWTCFVLYSYYWQLFYDVYYHSHSIFDFS